MNILTLSHTRQTKIPTHTHTHCYQDRTCSDFIWGCVCVLFCKIKIVSAAGSMMWRSLWDKTRFSWTHPPPLISEYQRNRSQSFAGEISKWLGTKACRQKPHQRASLAGAGAGAGCRQTYFFIPLYVCMYTENSPFVCMLKMSKNPTHFGEVSRRPR